MAKRGRGKELAELIEQRVSALVREMEDADWHAEDVALEIEAVVKRNWLETARRLKDARGALPDEISDGNEG